MALQKDLKLPGFSSIVTASTASRFSPISVRSDITQAIKIHIGAALDCQQGLVCHFVLLHIFFQASQPMAPEGSQIALVSL